MPKLYFRYSTMNAGKSTQLLQVAHNYEERNRAVLVFTAAIDDRVEQGIVASRIGLQREAALYGPETDFWQAVVSQAERPACVLVEEANFLTQAHVRQLAKVVDDLKIPVMCFGIRTDFRGELFEGSAALFAWADDIEELKTICHCGQKATMVVRKAEDGTVETDGPQVKIGGNDTYEVFCRKHWRALTNL